MRLVDPHCHLQDAKFDADRDELIARSLAELEWLVVVGDNLQNSRIAVNMVQPGVYATVALHPYHAKDLDDAALETLRALATRPGVVAIGETGLDYFNEFSPRAAQQEAFHAQLGLAAERDLPVVIHNREADADALAILREHAPALPGVVMHCFGSDAACAEACVDLGFYVSFAGNVTFPKAQALRDAAAVVPLDRIMAETDAPYLAPQPRRGKRCEPAYVAHTIAQLAEVKGIEPDAMAEHCANNAAALFRV